MASNQVVKWFMDLLSIITFSHPYFSDEYSSSSPKEYSPAEDHVYRTIAWGVTVAVMSGWFIYETIGVTSDDVLYFSGQPEVHGFGMLLFGIVALMFNGHYVSRHVVGFFVVLPAVFFIQIGFIIHAIPLFSVIGSFLNSYFTFIFTLFGFAVFVCLYLYLCYYVTRVCGMISREFFLTLWKKEPNYISTKQSRFHHTVSYSDWRTIYYKRQDWFML